MATQVIATQNNTPMEIVERFLVQGDLAKLSSDERVFYYKSVCESVGLNPLTKPFEYITLNGKLTLYARKDCTDQLRTIHGVSLTIVARELVDGIYVVTSRATKPDGRCDESLGAVPVEGLKGELRANAFMKCETKSKRRVTLSICGLGMLDEIEIESIPTIDQRGSKEAAQAVAQRKIAEMKSEPDLVPVLQASIVQAKQKREPMPSEHVPSGQPLDVTPDRYPNDVLQKHWREMKDFKSIVDKLGWAKEKLHEFKGDEGIAEYYRILDEFEMKHANEFKTPSNGRLCFEQLWQIVWDCEQAIPV